MLSKHGFDVTGVDTSSSGIEHAKSAFPHVRLEIGSAYDDLASRYGKFDLVVSLEVIEHCMDPRAFARTFLDLIAPGGIGFLSTPYHDRRRCSTPRAIEHGASRAASSLLHRHSAADAFDGYNRLYLPDRKPGPIVEALCLSHGRRKVLRTC